MADGMSKAHQRRSKKHEGYYLRQFEVTKLNKIIRMATHIGRRMYWMGTDTRSGSIRGWWCDDQKAFHQMHAASPLALRNALTKAQRRNNLMAVRALEVLAFD